MKPQSLRTWLGLGAAGLMWAACSTSSGPESATVADLVLTGGRVVTVDEAESEVHAIAIRGTEIVALGTADEIDSWVGRETEVVDLAGRLVVPGFIEGHGHFLSLGNALTILDLSTARSWDDIVAQVAEAVTGAQPGEWIRGRGWHQEKWNQPPENAVEGSPVHASLSAVSPDNPVLLGHASGHAAFANAKALELAGLADDSAPPPGGELVRDAAGALTGLLRETAQRPVAAAMERDRAEREPELIDRERRRMVELAGGEALSKGVTSFHDAGASFDDIDFLKTLETEGALPIRLYVMVRYPEDAENDELDRKLPAYRTVAGPNDFLVVRSIKRQIDGALGSHGAWLLEPYDDMPSSVGLVLDPEDEIRRTAELAIRHGYQVNTHAIGDRANRRVLDIYQQAFEAAEGGGADRRWRIEHAQHLHPDDIPRFAELGVIASMQGVHCTSDGPWVPKRIGAERSEAGAYVWRRLIDSGALVTNGTDVPVEDIDPIASFYSSVSRKSANGETFYPGQRMTRYEALASYTRNSAYAAFEEDAKGSLEVGKLADLVVLSKDILAVPDDQIPDARVDLTVLGGEIVYRRETD